MQGIRKVPQAYSNKKGTYVCIDGIRIAKTHCLVWTLQAAACYLRGCNCEACPTKDLVEKLESTKGRCLVKLHVRAYFFFGVKPPEQVIKQTKKMIKNMEI